MKLKSVITISLVIFVLCIGAVSASQDFACDNSTSSSSIITEYESDDIAAAGEDLNQDTLGESNGNSLEKSVDDTDDLEAGSKGTFIDATDAYIYLNDFRTQKGVWYWNSDDTTKTVFNTNSGNTLEPLLRSTELEKTAKIRAQEIVKLFEHTRPDGSDCFSAYPDDLWACGENIAYGYSTCKSVTVAWEENDDMYDGQGHRRNMLEPYFNCVGIAGFKINGVTYWVQAFGTYDPIPSATTNKVAKKTKTSITASAKKTFKAKVKSKKITVTLKASKKAIKKAKLYLTVKGKTYKATTNSKGKATFKITKLTKKGKYTGKIKYKGTSKYFSSQKTIKIIVKK